MVTRANFVALSWHVPFQRCFHRFGLSASMLLTRCVKALGCAMSVCKVGFGIGKSSREKGNSEASVLTVKLDFSTLIKGGKSTKGFFLLNSDREY